MGSIKDKEIEIRDNQINLLKDIIKENSQFQTPKKVKKQTQKHSPQVINKLND